MTSASGPTSGAPPAQKNRASAGRPTSTAASRKSAVRAVASDLQSLYTVIQNADVAPTTQAAAAAEARLAALDTLLRGPR